MTRMLLRFGVSGALPIACVWAAEWNGTCESGWLSYHFKLARSVVTNTYNLMLKCQIRKGCLVISSVPRSTAPSERHLQLLMSFKPALLRNCALTGSAFPFGAMSIFGD